MTLISITSTYKESFFPQELTDLPVFCKMLILALDHFFYCWYVWVEGGKNNTESPQTEWMSQEESFSGVCTLQTM